MAEFLHITDSNQEISNKILKALAEVLSPHFQNTVPKIKKSVVQLVKEAISSSPEMKSISGGTLQFDIGLSSGQAEGVVEIFSQAVANSIDVSFTGIKKSGRKLKGGITITIQPLTYANIPNIPLVWKLTSGEIADVKSLLIQLGDSMLVFPYEIEYGPFGRSGGARMERQKESRWGIGSGSSRVPPSFSGTFTDNFITRTLKKNSFESMCLQAARYVPE